MVGAIRICPELIVPDDYIVAVCILHIFSGACDLCTGGAYNDIFCISVLIIGRNLNNSVSVITGGLEKETVLEILVGALFNGSFAVGLS